MKENNQCKCPEFFICEKCASPDVYRKAKARRDLAAAVVRTAAKLLRG